MRAVLTWSVGRASDDEPPPPISPFGPVGAYVLACWLGGAVLGTVVAAIAHAVRGAGDRGSTSLLVLAAIFAIPALVLEWSGRFAPLMQSHWQVPRRWLLWSNPVRTAAAFGVVVGAGVFTRLQHAAAYVLGATLILAPSIWAGAVLGATYGLSRGGTVAGVWVTRRFLGVELPWIRLAQSRALNRSLTVIGAGSIAASILVFAN